MIVVTIIVVVVVIENGDNILTDWFPGGPKETTKTIPYFSKKPSDSA
jgi:hypothetical protein